MVIYIFIKGLIIGTGKIIPGVSGSLIAIALGEYENMINAINNYFNDITNYSKYLFKIGLGIFISIIVFSNVIIKLIDNYYIYTMFIFAGFILGSNKTLKDNMHINYIIISFSFLIILLINKLIITNIFLMSKTFIYYFFGGILDAVSMIIPGISGTSLLISYGCYEEVILGLSNIIVYKNILIPFVIGMIIGALITIKLAYILLNKYKNNTYNSIIGISIATILIMLKNGIEYNTGFISIMLSIVLLIIGYYTSKKLIAILTIN